MDAEASSKLRRVEPDSDEPPASFDLISALPDEMLHIIISLVPIKSAVGTSVLSKRWRYLWRSVLLDLTVDHNLSNKESKRLAVVSKIIATHPGPFKRLFIGFFSGNCKVDPTFGKWFRSSAMVRLEEFSFRGGTPKSRRLPQSAFYSVPTLRIVSLWSCHIHDIDAALLSPLLKQLQLYDVFISRLNIHRLIAGCTALEILQLEGMHGFTSLRVVSQSLQTIGVSNMIRYLFLMEFQELVIQDAPSLERLVVLGPVDPNSVRVVSVPKLRMLGFMRSESFQLLIGVLTVERIIPNRLIPCIRKMKFLVQRHIVQNLDTVDEFLRSLYSREKLYIESEIDDHMTNVLEYNTFYPMNALFEISWTAQSYLMYEAISQLMQNDKWWATKQAATSESLCSAMRYLTAV